MHHKIEIQDQDYYPFTLVIDPRIMFIVHVPIHSATHYPDFHIQASLQNSCTNACVPCREAVCTISLIVFFMTLPLRETTTYRMRGSLAIKLLMPSQTNRHNEIRRVSTNERLVGWCVRSSFC